MLQSHALYPNPTPLGEITLSELVRVSRNNTKSVGEYAAGVDVSCVLARVAVYLTAHRSRSRRARSICCLQPNRSRTSG